MPLSISIVFGRRAMNSITAADYVEWATGMLTNGKDSPNLRMLAGFDVRGSVFEAEEHFTHALHELQIPEPDSAGKLRAYGVDLASRFWMAGCRRKRVSSRSTRFALAQIMHNPT